MTAAAAPARAIPSRASPPTGRPPDRTLPAPLDLHRLTPPPAAAPPGIAKTGQTPRTPGGVGTQCTHHSHLCAKPPARPGGLVASCRSGRGRGGGWGVLLLERTR